MIRLISYSRLIIFLSLILLAPLSKYPSLALPLYNFTSFRLGLYQILALIFVIMCGMPTIKYIFKIWSTHKPVIVSLVAIVIVSIFGFSSAIYKERSALLVSSIIFLIILLSCSWWYVASNFSKYNLNLIIKLMLFFSIIFGLLGIIQLILSTFSSETLGILCKGCVGGVLGFPRINLFAAEPQFLANAMIPFFFLSVIVNYIKISKLPILALLFNCIAIGLTFSRGAFIAISIGLLCLILALIYKKNANIKKMLQLVVIIFVGFVISFSMLIASASCRYKHTPNITYNTADTMLEQLSAGRIKLPPVKNLNKPEQSSLPINNNSDFISPGFIKASANERISAAKLAFNAWRYNIKNILIGVGPGNLGPFVVNNIDNSAPNNLTVYIFYILFLTEMGLVGLLAFFFIIFYVLYSLIKLFIISKNNAFIYLTLVTILISFMVQYCFFGTFINNIYFWVYIGCALGISNLPQKKGEAS